MTPASIPATKSGHAARDLGKLIPSQVRPPHSSDWPLGVCTSDAVRNTVAAANGKHSARRFTGAPITGFGEFA